MSCWSFGMKAGFRGHLVGELVEGCRSLVWRRGEGERSAVEPLTIIAAGLEFIWVGKQRRKHELEYKKKVLGWGLEICKG